MKCNLCGYEQPAKDMLKVGKEHMCGDRDACYKRVIDGTKEK